MKTKFRLVAKDTFVDFIVSYPNKLKTDRYPDFMITYNDFSNGKVWPDSTVAYVEDYESEKYYILNDE